MSRTIAMAFIIVLAGSETLQSQIQSTEVPVFRDVTESSGLKFKHHSPFTNQRHLHLTMGSGVAWIDIDQDGWPDVCLGQGATWNGSPQPQSRDEHQFHDEHNDRVFRNRIGKFNDVTLVSGIANHQYSMGLAVGDFDNDGFSDIYTSCFGRCRLHKNFGDGTFEEISFQTESDPWIVAASCTWIDADLDGFLDLYVTNYIRIDEQKYAVCSQSHLGNRVSIPCPPRKYEWLPDSLFKNLGDGRFIDISESSGLTALPASAGLGVITNDFNDDQFPDLYVANDTTANFLLLNDGNGVFFDNAIVGGAGLNRIGEAEAGMGVCGGDVDGDHRPDVFVGNYYGESNTLYRNEGHGLFFDVTAEFGLAAPSRTRLAFGTLMCDFNNDSWPDLFVANGHLSDQLAEVGMQIPFRQKSQLFINEEGRRFNDSSADSGSYFEREVLGRGCAAADYDLDGDVDVVVQHLDDFASLLQNAGSPQNRSVAIKLIGRNGNRDAIGAKLELQTIDRRLTRERDGSSSYLSCNDCRLVVGVGKRDKPVSANVQWPRGTRVISSGIKPGRQFCIVEGHGSSFENRVLEIPD